MVDKILRLLPNFKGKHRLSKLLIGNDLQRLKNIFINGKYNCNYFIPNIVENIGFDIYINGIYEKETIDFLIKNIPPNKIFVDIGANIGAISLPVCKIRIDIKAVCVEAASWVFDILKKNIETNSIATAVLLNNAIFDESNKDLIFYVPKQEFGKGSLLQFCTQEKVIVKSITIADILKNLGYSYGNIGFIKIDIEGYEYFALKGGADFFSALHAPDILFEFVDWAEGSVEGIQAGAAQRLLIDYGYDIFIFDNGQITSKIEEVIVTGTHMFYATKSKNVKREKISI
jgi:methyltransferase, FkbM family